MYEKMLCEPWLIKTDHVGVPEWKLPHGVRGGAGPPSQTGAPHGEGPRAGVWHLCSATRPHRSEGELSRPNTLPTSLLIILIHHSRQAVSKQ